MRKAVNLCVKWLSLKSHKPSGHIPVSHLDGLWGMVGLRCCWSLSVEYLLFSSLMVLTTLAPLTIPLQLCLWLASSASQPCFPSRSKCSWHSVLRARSAPDPFLLPQDFPWAPDFCTSWVSQFGCPEDTSNSSVLPNSLSQWVIPTAFHPSIQALNPEYDSCH